MEVRESEKSWQDFWRKLVQIWTPGMKFVDNYTKISCVDHIMIMQS